MSKNTLLSSFTMKTVSSLMLLPAFRQLGKRILKSRIDDVVEREQNRGMPYLMARDKGQMMNNMIEVFDRWITDGNARKETVKKLFSSFSRIIQRDNTAIFDAYEAKYGQRPPRFTTISPTKHCNLRCVGCYAASSENTNIHMDFDHVDRIVREQKELWGSHFVVISGGEPMMYHSQGKNILDLVERHPDVLFLMYTNGTLITDEAADRMAELGNITPSISVEGFEEETDWRRGKGVHKKIREAFERLHRAGVVYGISVTATNKNADLVLSPEFINYYINQLHVYYIWMFQYMPIGRSYSLDLMVTPQQRKDLLDRMYRWLYDEEIFIADFWNSGTISNGCLSAGRSGGYVYIDWNGDVMPCVFNPYTKDNIIKTFEQGGTINDVVNSDFMKEIRTWQQNYFEPESGKLGNMFTPCPIKDHHWDMREIIDRVEAQPANEDAAHALEDDAYYKGMVRFGEEIERVTADKWEREYVQPKSKKEAEQALQSESSQKVEQKIES